MKTMWTIDETTRTIGENNANNILEQCVNLRISDIN